MHKLTLAILGCLLGLGSSVHAQTQFRTPNSTNSAPLTVMGCVVGGLAVPCGSDTAPLAVTPATGGATQNVAASQTGIWRFSPRTGTPVASSVVAVGTTSIEVVPASATRSWLVVQNPGTVGANSNTNGLWCRIDGGTAVAGPPSFHIMPGQTWAPGSSSGYIPTAAINCISLAAGSPVTAWSVP